MNIAPMSESIQNKEIKEELEKLKSKERSLESQVNTLFALTSSPIPRTENGSNEIDLRQLWGAIWSGKWFIILVTSLFAITSIFYSLSLSDEYKSTAILSPSSSSASSLSKLAGQFGGLASLAGISLGSSGDEDKTTIAIELVKTWGFTEDFIAKNQIEVEVFAVEGWDRKNNKLIIDSSLYNESEKKWVRDFSSAKGQTQNPGSWELYKKFKKIMEINQDRKTGLVSLSIKHYSPYVAKEWVDNLVISINLLMKENDRLEALKSIEYLKQQIELTNLAEMKNVFYQLIEEQTKTLMLTEISDEYVLKTISPAKLAEEKSAPNRVQIIILFTILGGILSTAGWLFRFYLTKSE